ncbi:DEAD/DEAH box helicase [Streptomyces antimycoticus]|uniref:DEAD/DEAH box helicase n=1 Tax=Streptomyces antimycoticus TaxID=68175 RepID=UPI003F4E311D
MSFTGSGKTITAAAAALRMLPRGLVGIVVPTLELLTQTVEAWRAVGHSGPAVALCSLGSDPLLEALDVRCTTNPAELARWARSGPMVVPATYANLSRRGQEDPEDDEDAAVPGVLEQAMRRASGERMGAFERCRDRAHHHGRGAHPGRGLPRPGERAHLEAGSRGGGRAPTAGSPRTAPRTVRSRLSRTAGSRAYGQSQVNFCRSPTPPLPSSGAPSPTLSSSTESGSRLPVLPRPRSRPRPRPRPRLRRSMRTRSWR